MTLIEKILNRFKKIEIKEEMLSLSEPKQYTQEELNSLTYVIDDVYWVTLKRNVKTKNMPKPKREIKSILAIRAGDDLYMDIETGKYYEASRFISDLNAVNVWTAYEMPYRFYVIETLMDKHIDYDDSLTANQLRELIIIQRDKHKHSMYDSANWGVNK